MTHEPMRFLVLVSALGLIGCPGCPRKADDPFAGHKKTSMDMAEFQEDVSVPLDVSKAIDALYRPMALDPEGQAVKEGVSEKSDGKKKAVPMSDEQKAQLEEAEELLRRPPPTEDFSFHVYLIEKTNGVLGDQSYDLKFPPGGGVLDYRYFLPETKDGSFYLKFVPDISLDPKDTRIFYVSNSKVRDMDGEALGNGCDRYFDISNYWKSQMKGQGFFLNTVNNRHISVTAGTYFIAEPYLGKLRVAHLVVRDSRHSELECNATGGEE